MKKYILFAAAGLVLTACGNDCDNFDEEPVAVHISATIGESALTRASDTSWSKGDAIGISMGDRYVNMLYTTEEGNGIFSGPAMYFRNKREPVTLTSYYPYSSNVGESAIIEAYAGSGNQTPEKQPGIDFLYAVKENVTGASPEVKLEFSHKMSKLSLIFINGEGAKDIRISSYSIDGLILKGTFDTGLGVCTADETAPAEKLDVALSGATDGVQLPSLIVFPQKTLNKTVTLTITDNEDQVYACDLKFQNNIEPGNSYRFNITVKKTGLVVNQSTITDWNVAEQTDTDASSVNPKKTE